MPKDEFDFDDPMELNGVGLASAEDTTEAMTECFVEEFMRLGHNHKQILAMFRNPHYIGMNMAFQNRGEQFVCDMIVEVFARCGKSVVWSSGFSQSEPSSDGWDGIPNDRQGAGAQAHACTAPEQAVEVDATTTDPMGVPIPKLNV